MGKEIERKFLLSELPSFTEKVKPIHIQQGYIAVEPNGVAVRIRKADDRYIMTTKSHGGIERIEVEFPIEKQYFEALWPLTVGRRIEKLRFVVHENNLAIEIDQFKGDLEGLYLAEVEFSSREEANQFVPSSWMQNEVTEVDFFKNRNLSTIKDFQAIQLQLNQL